MSNEQDTAVASVSVDDVAATAELKDDDANEKQHFQQQQPLIQLALGVFGNTAAEQQGQVPRLLPSTFAQAVYQHPLQQSDNEKNNNVGIAIRRDDGLQGSETAPPVWMDRAQTSVPVTVGSNTRLEQDLANAIDREKLLREEVRVLKEREREHLRIIEDLKKSLARATGFSQPLFPSSSSSSSTLVGHKQTSPILSATKLEQNYWLPDFNPQDPSAVRVVRQLGRGQHNVCLVEIFDSNVVRSNHGQPLQLAMKRMHMPESEYHQDMLVSEMNTQRMCCHENILPLRYSRILDDSVYLFMPVMSKGLDFVIAQHDVFPNESSYRLNLSQIVIGIARGLQYLHTGLEIPVVHCDLKPSNVLVRFEHLDDIEYPGVLKITRVCISDFGGAKAVITSLEHQITSVAVHSQHYSAPEQKINFYHDKSVRVDEKADVYSFGITLGELLTRRRHSFTRLERNVHLFDGTWDVDFSPTLFTEVELKELGNATDLLIGLYRLCTKVNPPDRPSMAEVTQMLECNLDHAFVTVDLHRLKSLELLPVPRITTDRQCQSRRRQCHRKQRAISTGRFKVGFLLHVTKGYFVKDVSFPWSWLARKCRIVDFVFIQQILKPCTLL